MLLHITSDIKGNHNSAVSKLETMLRHTFKSVQIVCVRADVSGNFSTVVDVYRVNDTEETELRAISNAFHSLKEEFFGETIIIFHYAPSPISI